jgi:hypothetical protein
MVYAFLKRRDAGEPLWHVMMTYLPWVAAVPAIEAATLRLAARCGLSVLATAIAWRDPMCQQHRGITCTPSRVL